MKKKFSILLVAISTAFHAQETQERSIESFTRIEVSGIANVYYSHSDTLSLKVVGNNFSGNEKQIEKVKTNVENGTLKISTKGLNKYTIDIYVSYNNLREINCLGTATFKTQNIIKCDTLNIALSDASSVNIKTESKNIVIQESDAASLTLEGTSDNLDAKIADATTLKAYKLITKNVHIKTSNASSAKIYVTDKLIAEAGDASSIKVKGDVKDIHVDVSSVAASVTQIHEKPENQSGNDKDGSTTFEWKGKKIIIADDDKKDSHLKKTNTTKKFNHWAGFSLGVNGLLAPNGSFTMKSPYNYLDLNYSRSINLQLNIFQHNFHLYKNYINLVTGFGVEWRRYMLDQKTTLNPDSSFTWGTIDNSNTYKYNKNLLRSTMLQVPLLLDFNTNSRPSKSFHLSVGAIGQFMIGSRTKQKLESNGDEFTKTNKDTYNMNPLSVKAHASIGYSKFTAFTEYNITELFNKNKGPQMNPFVIGVRVIPF